MNKIALIKNAAKIVKDPLFAFGAAIGVASWVIVDGISAIARPAVAVVHTFYNEETGEEFYHGHCEKLAINKDKSKPAKVKITIERRHSS